MSWKQCALRVFRGRNGVRIINGDANSEDLYGGICEHFCAGLEEDERSESTGIDGVG